jgi:hypothetical protein
MKRFLAVLLFLLMLIGGLLGAAWHFREPLMIRASEWLDAQRNAFDPGPRPDPQRYAILSSEAERWRNDLATRYQVAKTSEQKAAIENEARILLEHVLPSMMRCWIGTGWDFNGTSETPGKGKIACGYFVSTVLRDAGFKVNRYRLAQQASANIIHSFINPQDCSLSVGVDYQEFLADTAKKPDGIYIVGLDTHVAFLVKTGDSFRFIHSSGSKPWQVVDESPTDAKVLERSRWRMLGNLTASPNAIRTWLQGRKVKVLR